jgi:hypothetical protein
MAEGFGPDIKLARTQTIMQDAGHRDCRYTRSGSMADIEYDARPLQLQPRIFSQQIFSIGAVARFPRRSPSFTVPARHIAEGPPSLDGPRQLPRASRHDSGSTATRHRVTTTAAARRPKANCIRAQHHDATASRR